MTFVAIGALRVKLPANNTGRLRVNSLNILTLLPAQGRVGSTER